jgi:hypothetical protein
MDGTTMPTLLGNLPPYGLDALEQLAILFDIHQRNQSIADLKGQYIDGRQRFKRLGGLLCCTC